MKFRHPIRFLLLFILCLGLGLAAAPAFAAPVQGEEADPTPSEATAEPTEQPNLITITGKITHGGGLSLPSGLPVTLHHYDSMQLIDLASTQTDAEGRYSFTDVNTGGMFLLLTTVKYRDITFASSVFHADQAADGETVDLPITVYEPSYDLAGLITRQVHVFFDFPTPETLQMVQVFVIANRSDKTVVGDDPASPLLFFELPAGAVNLQYEDAFQAQRFIRQDNRLGYLFVLNPGEEMQVLFSFDLPYPSSSGWLSSKPKLDLSIPLPLPVEQVQAILPQGNVRLQSEQLQSQGTQSMGENVFQSYRGGRMEQGSRLAMTLSGSPAVGASGNLLGDRWVTILVGGLGVLLIAGGGVAYWRYRRTLSTELNECGGGEEVLPQTAGVDQPNAEPAVSKEDLLDAVLDLEERFEAGEMDRETFERRRSALKEQLRELLE